MQWRNSRWRDYSSIHDRLLGSSKLRKSMSIRVMPCLISCDIACLVCPQIVCPIGALLTIHVGPSGRSRCSYGFHPNIVPTSSWVSPKKAPYSHKQQLQTTFAQFTWMLSPQRSHVCACTDNHRAKARRQRGASWTPGRDAEGMDHNK
jgi:hypothetical protein